MIMTRRIITPPTRHNLIFISFHHICFLTLFAPRLNPCALTARLSVFDSSESRRSPRSATLLILSRMMPTYCKPHTEERDTVSSICCWIAAVLGLEGPCSPGAAPFDPEGIYGSYGSFAI